MQWDGWEKKEKMERRRRVDRRIRKVLSAQLGWTGGEVLGFWKEGIDNSVPCFIWTKHLPRHFSQVKIMVINIK